MENKIIVGAYPSAPSFHSNDQKSESEFWSILSKNEFISGVEQPFLNSLHPFGNDYILKAIPDNWDIVITAVMQTMGNRKTIPGFGLASSDEIQRQACIDYYKKIYTFICTTNDKYQRQKIPALELQSAPNKNDPSIDNAAKSFQKSIDEITRWDWPCELIIEHCDAMNGLSPRKGFLPLDNELDIIKNRNIGICINWARSVIEGRSTETPIEHIIETNKKGKLKSVMFSGTTTGGPYGEWDDLHAPFAPFDGCEVICNESLMSLDTVQNLFKYFDVNSLDYIGVKLLEIDENASVIHRTSIINDGVKALRQLIKNS